METQNEIKAKEIAMPCQGCECEWTKEKMYKQQYCKDCVAQDKFIAAMQAMEWKDEEHAKEKQKLIDRATKWFSENYCYITDKHYDVEVVHELIDELKQAMKGE